jgi:tetratricopeptide (TPR) repeat protein
MNDAFDSPLRRNALCLAALFLVGFGVYLRGLSPAFHPDDSAETITAGVTLSIQHPPGYPLHSLLGRLAFRLGPGPAAFNINALAAFCAALALVLAALLLQRLATEFAPWACRRGEVLGLALPAALAIGMTQQLRFQATIAKGGIYTLNLALSLGVLLALLGARDALLCAEPGSAPSSRFWQRLSLAALLFGVGLTNHWTSMVLLAPAALILLGEPLYLRRPALVPADALRLLPALGFGVAGLAVYAYIPLRTRLGAPLIWGPAGTLKELLWILTRSQYAGVEAGKTLAQFAVLLKYIAAKVYEDWTPLGLLALAGGWALLLRHRLWLGLGLLSLPLGLAVAVAWKANPPSDSFFIMDPYLIPLHAGLGLGLAGWAQKGALRIYAGLGFLGLALGLGLWHHAKVEHREDYLAYDYIHDLLLSAPKDAILFCEGDSNSAGPLLPRYVLSQRKDLSLVATVLIDYPWYQQRLRELDPRLQVPGQPLGSPASDMAWMAEHNAPRPAVWTNTYTKGWVDEAHLLPRGLVLRRQALARPWKPELLLNERIFPAYAMRGVFAPDAREMDPITVRLVRDNYIEAYDRLARCLADSKATAAACREYRLIGALRPGWAAPWLQSGSTAWFGGDVNAAASDWTRAGEEEPGSAEAWANQGLVAFQRKQYDQAAALARKALGLNKDLPNAIQLLAQAQQAGVAPPTGPAARPGGELKAVAADKLAGEKKWAEALALYDQALAMGYVNAAVHRNRGVMLGQLGRNEEASQALAKAMQLAPNSPDITKLYGYFLFNAGHTKAGADLLETAHKLAPQDADIARLAEQARKAVPQ